MEHQLLETEVALIGDKVRFSGRSRSNPEVIMAYFPLFVGSENTHA